MGEEVGGGVGEELGEGWWSVEEGELVVTRGSCGRGGGVGELDQSVGAGRSSVRGTQCSWLSGSRTRAIHCGGLDWGS